MANAEAKDMSAVSDKQPDGERHLTRAFVLGALCDEDEQEEYWQEVLQGSGAENYGQGPQEPKTVDIDLAQGILEDGSKRIGAEPILQEIRSWIDTLCEEEQSTVDPRPEYKFEHIVVHSEGSELPSFASERGGDGLPRMLVKAPGLALDTGVLNRISEGKGPRSKECEDLIAPLRLENPEEDVRSTKSFVEETYLELLGVLRAWNRHVGVVSDLTKDRQELLDALEERDKLITDIEKGCKGPKDLDRPWPRLRQALRAFRPEIAKFENQNHFDILVMMVANLRIADSDLDEEMKDAIIKVIFGEVRLELLSDEEYLVKRRILRSQINSARRRKKHLEVKFFQKQIRDVRSKGVVRRAERTIDYIKAARGNLYSKVLSDMQDLAVQQAGQKWFASERMSAPDELARKCLEAGDALDSSFENLQIAEALSEADTANVAQMLKMAKDCYVRTRKFAAHDVKDPADRERIMRERMQDPKTASMMMKVVEDKEGIKQLPELVLKHMTKLEKSLETVHEAASRQFRALDGMLLVVGEDPEVEEAEGTDNGLQKGRGEGGKRRGNGDIFNELVEEL